MVELRFPRRVVALYSCIHVLSLSFGKIERAFVLSSYVGIRFVRELPRYLISFVPVLWFMFFL